MMRINLLEIAKAPVLYLIFWPKRDEILPCLGLLVFSFFGLLLIAVRALR